VAINWVEDLGAPLAVVAIDLSLETTAPDWNEWASYAVVALGYTSDILGIGPKNNMFVKNMAIAATPWAAKHIYTRVRAATGGVSRKGSRVGRWPAQLVEQPFGGARMV